MKEKIQKSYIMASPKTFVALSKHSLSRYPEFQSNPAP